MVLTRPLRRLAATACLLVAAIVLPAPGAAAQRVTADGLANLPAVAPAMDCADVPGLDLTGVTDAPVTIQSARVVPGAAPYCEVRGTVAPANTVVLRLPVHGWTQRYVQTGCGGLCGSAACAAAR
ncbi:hypothetical protein [Amycolatopsis sp. ATCC 39116]|uniref:hypothetical protein n=1 Tax=Amycolatopsis sp. (strain ATCC 39116 / 75iv2) TaxID=385957 RepID=UPI001930CB75|nr:hypothetical protein [Amycolatopsis sp. ATCC 39116]